MEKSQNAIEVRNVKKSFKVYYDRGVALKDKVLSRGRSRYENREVLKGISFDVKKGEAVGLIGKNGCGKSTTLKLLTKIIYPNEGTVEMRGRVSSLLELGAGFHPDMSGRENIYMNAAIFGLTRKEIDRRVNDIIEFSELEDFIENPVRTYSSGMYMRLAFSVAINVDADILLIDEILAVGDISFQKKCFDRLKDIKNKGTTIVIVSHSFDQIEKICDKSVWIKEGKIQEEGIPKVVHKHYLDYMEQERVARLTAKQKKEEEAMKKKREQEEAKRKEEERKAKKRAQEEAKRQEAERKAAEKAAKKAAEDARRQAEEESRKAAENAKNQWMATIRSNPNLMESLSEDVFRRGDQERVKLTRVNIVDSNGKQDMVFRTGDPMTMLVEFEAYGDCKRGTIGISFRREDDVYCFGTNTFIEMQKVMNLSEGSGVLINFPELNLLPGKYLITVGMHDDISAAFYDQVDKAFQIEMVNLKGDLGICRMHSEWVFMDKKE